MGDLAVYWSMFGDAFLASLVVAVVLPLVGVLLYLRRSAFLGVAVPQFSAAGLALGLWVLPWFPPLYRELLEHGHPPMLYMFLFAVIGAGVALGVFSVLEERSGHGSRDGRLAAGFTVATALSILFLTAAPTGESLVRTILRGEILYLDHHGLGQLAGAYGVVLLGLVLFRRALLLFAFDSDFGIGLGHGATTFGRLQMLLVGIAIGGGVMTVGPVLVFGLLFLPPLAAGQVATNMRRYLLHVLLVGLSSCVAAWPVSIWLDAPYGPIAVVIALLLTGGYAIAAGLQR